jgi:hypothetical protein
MAARLLRHALLSAIESEHEHTSDLTFITYTVVSVLLVILAGLMSGLTLGLMSLDMVDLEVCPPPVAPCVESRASCFSVRSSVELSILGHRMWGWCPSNPLHAHRFLSAVEPPRKRHTPRRSCRYVARHACRIQHKTAS